jgi:hypothetical protein
VIVLQEGLPVVNEEMIHPRPNRVPFRLYGVRLKGDKWRAARLLYSPKILVTEVRLVCRYVAKPEVLGGGLDQRDKVVGVVGGPAANICAGNNLRLNAAHQVKLDPLPVVGFASDVRS